MISRAVLAAVLALAFACTAVHGEIYPTFNCSMFDLDGKKVPPYCFASCAAAMANRGKNPRYPYAGNAFNFDRNYGIGSCHVHPWYGTGICTQMKKVDNYVDMRGRTWSIPSYGINKPFMDEPGTVEMKCDASSNTVTPPPRPIKKELLNFSPFGPRMTDCNRCFVKFPEIRESCNAYDQWEKVRQCVDTHRVFVTIDKTGATAKFYAERESDRKFSCNEREIATVAATCILRNTLSKRNPKNCMSNDDCTKFMSQITRMTATVPDFGDELTIDTVCADVTNWFSNPPSCGDAVAMKKLNKCLREGDQSKWNEVAKGYVRAWYEEYYFRVCRGNDHHSKMIGANLYQTAYYPDVHSFTAEEREKIVVKGLNWDN